MNYVRPVTAIEYLEKTGLNRRAICRYAGIGFPTLLRVLKSKTDPTVRQHVDTQKKLQAAFERRRAEMEADAKVREEEGL